MEFVVGFVIDDPRRLDSEYDPKRSHSQQRLPKADQTQLAFTLDTRWMGLPLCFFLRTLTSFGVEGDKS